MLDKRIKNNMIIQMLKSREVAIGGFIENEEFYMKKYGFSEDEMTLIQSAIYMIKHIGDVEDFDIKWKNCH